MHRLARPDRQGDRRPGRGIVLTLLTDDQVAAVPDSGRPRSDDYRFDAFISYRHTEPDRRWAKWLHRNLETYRVPKALAAERGLPRRLRRVFRDEEELPASSDLKAEIDAALRQSRFLIVVCS